MEDPLDSIFYCDICQYSTHRKNNYKTHMNSKRHKINTNEIEKEEKIFECNLCNFRTNRKYCLTKHLNTNKHKNEEKMKMLLENQMKDNASPSNDNLMVTQEMFMELMNHNKKLMEVVQNGTNSMTNCHNNNNTNTFNLQVFLNETCKDAINMKDFVNSIEVTIGDLKNLGRRGYVESISSLMIKKLNDLDVTKRPIHSSDVKRETLYIKDNGTWEKDNDQKERLRKVLWDITRLKTCALEEKYKLMYPQVETDRDSKEHNEYWKIFHNAMGGDAGSVDHLQSKVIKRVVQNVAINKDLF